MTIPPFSGIALMLVSPLLVLQREKKQKVDKKPFAKGKDVVLGPIVACFAGGKLSEGDSWANKQRNHQKFVFVRGQYRQRHRLGTSDRLERGVVTFE